MQAMFLLFTVMITVVLSTPLDDYVNAADPTYQYEHVSTIAGFNYDAFVLRLTSQTWLTPHDSDTSVWMHWVTVCVPHNLESTDTGMVYIDGDSDTSNAPTSVDAMTLSLCTKTRSVVSDIRQIPNEPIVFNADPLHKRRTEDAIIAFTWWQFLQNTTEPNWLLRLPMTNAVVKAMDMIQDFTQKKLPHIGPLEKFVVAGASKRGWTTWTVGAVDKRVSAIAPIVMPILNMIPSINMLYRAYGNWSFALDDYVEMGVIKYLNTPQFLEMAKVIDPYTYIDRLTMPKYLICSTGDEFFLPDSTRNFYHDLKGETHLRMVPDAEHSLIPQDLDVAIAIGTWVYMHIHNIPIPKYTWSMVRSNSSMASITVNCETPPTSVTLWKSHTLSNTLRDFRLLTCAKPECFQPVLWFWSGLEDQGNGTYVAEVPVPVAGWTGFLVEIEYAQSNNPLDPVATLKFTTEVNIVPDTFPFAPCGDKC